VGSNPTSSVLTRNTTLAVLAGGEGSRMGRPKGELRVGGRPILQYLLAQWKWTGPTILITAPGREKPPGWEAFDREVSDPAPGEGPLRGIVTALQLCAPADIIVIATCDMPRVTTQMLTHLASALAADESILAVMTRRGRTIEPFPMAVRRASMNVLRQRLERGERSLQSLTTLPQFTLIEPPADWGPDVWTNLNDPADYQRFLADTRQQ
jgi:molybdenum cofactor guanylyltransferase